MSNYVVTFRSDLSQQPSADQEAAWAAWFTQIGTHITDTGNRVGRAVMLGDGADTGDHLSGYIVIAADDLDAALQIARGCPGLTYGGRVEVGETMPAS